MLLQPGQTLPLLDTQHRQVGQITIEQLEGELLLGKFAPGPAFSDVEHLFRAFEQAVNHQALAKVDRLDAAIASLGLWLKPIDGSPPIPVHDVQIWSEGSISCRAAVPGLTPVTGGPNPP
jgi:hypothetical protein